MKRLAAALLLLAALALGLAFAETGRTSATIKAEVAGNAYNRTGDLARQDIAILLAEQAAGAPAGTGLARTTAAKSANYTVAAGFYHALVYVPPGVTATVDGIPLTGPTSLTLPSNFPARHATALPVTSISGGSVYVSETR